LHHGIDQAGHVGLPVADRCRRMLADLAGGHNPGHRREGSGPGRLLDAVDGLNVSQLAVLANGVEIGQRIPDPRSVRGLLHGRA
jgi:hypothetical protein